MIAIVVDVVSAVFVVRFGLYAVSESAAARRGSGGRRGMHYCRAAASAVAAAALVGCALAYDLDRSGALEICVDVGIVASVVFMLSGRRRVRTE